MLLDNYRKEMEAVGPSTGQMERLLTAIREEAPVRRPAPLRHALVAAAVCAALTLTALAVSPSLREALAASLGLFEPYSQSIEGLSVVNQGIEVRVVSALSDGNTAKVYYEMQDLTGDRLDEFTIDNVSILPKNWGKEGGPQWAAAGSVAYGGLVQYDPATKTALMVDGVKGDGPPAETLVLDLDIGKVLPGYHDETFPIDPAWIAVEPLKSLTLESGKSVLAPEQNPRELDSDLLSLSSFGYGEDGLLHLLVRAKDGVDSSQWEWADCHVGYSGGSSRSENRRGGPRTNRYVQTTDYKGMTEAERAFADPDTIFEVDGVTYYDCRTGITLADVAEGDVEWFETVTALLYTRPAIRGEWRLAVPTEMVEQTTIDMAPSRTMLAEVEAKSLHLSVLGCTLESDPHGAAGTLNYPLTVYLSDGSTLSPGHADGLFHAGGYAVNHWTFPAPVEPSQVTAVAIGMWYVSLEDGVAHPGYWLSELPK